MSKPKPKDSAYDKYDSYEHVYCRVCKHSLYFKTNHEVCCNYCGTLVYPSKKCEFKYKLNRELRKKGGKNENN